MLVREAPPLRLSFEVQSPGGARFRWGPDERRAVNVPQGVSWSDTMPGGFETLSLTLPREPGIDYADLDRMSTIRLVTPGGGTAGEFRLEKAPRTSGDQMAISPEAVGWQAHLSDNKSAREIYVDTDLTRWTNSPPASRSDALRLLNLNPAQEANVVPGPSLEIIFRDNWSGVIPFCVPQYIGKGIPIRNIYYSWSTGGWVNPADTLWVAELRASPNDLIPDADLDGTGDLMAAPTGSGTGTLTTTKDTRSWVEARFYYNNATGGTAGQFYALRYHVLAVYGLHGLTKFGTASASEAQGLRASDIATHAVKVWAPLLNITSESVMPSALPITQAAYFDATTVADIIHDVVRYELLDWAVWENRTFWMAPRNELGRNWRARIGPTQLQETGPQTDRLWNGVIVSYTDWGGETRNVGPPGSGADTETTDLVDADPENPATKLGIKRYEQLSAGKSMTAALATYLGQRFLQESKALDRSGQARIVGHVQDQRGGGLFPYHAIRAGDTISFTDAADPSPRRIVRTQKSASDFSVTLDLDAPPEGLQAILSRLDLKPNR